MSEEWSWEVKLEPTGSLVMMVEDRASKDAAETADRAIRLEDIVQSRKVLRTKLLLDGCGGVKLEPIESVVTMVEDGASKDAVQTACRAIRLEISYVTHH